MKSDERILGDGDFVTAMLAKNNEDIDNAYVLRSKGVDLEFIARRVARLLEVAPEDVWSPGRYKRLVMARSLLCYWAVRKLNVSMASMARRLGISTVAVSKSVRRGATAVKENNYQLIES